MRLLTVIALCVWITWARTLAAATVVIVCPANPSSQTSEALTFLHGELASIGLEDSTIEGSGSSGVATADARQWLEQLAEERHALAVLDIQGDDYAVDVWVRKSPGRFEVTRVTVEPDTANASARLAIRAIEALRASLIEIDLAARYRQEQRNTKASAARAPARHADNAATRAPRIGLQMGAALLMSPGGVDPSILPTLRVSWAMVPSLHLHGEVAAFGTRPSVTTAVGSARIEREFAVVGGAYRLWSNHQGWPFVSLAVGAQHTSTDGLPGQGMNAHSVDQWSLLADAGLGTLLRIYRNYHLSMSGHVQWAQPYVAIHFGDSTAATTARPNLLVALGVGAWL